MVEKGQSTQFKVTLAWNSLLTLTSSVTHATMSLYSLLDQSSADSEDQSKPLDTVLRAQLHQLYDSHCAACGLEPLCECGVSTH